MCITAVMLQPHGREPNWSTKVKVGSSVRKEGYRKVNIKGKGL